MATTTKRTEWMTFLARERDRWLMAARAAHLRGDECAEIEYRQESGRWARELYRAERR